jgi:hypothetical protein
MNATGRPAGRQAAVLAGVIVAAVAGYFAYRAWRKPPTQPSVDEGQAAAESFLAAVRSDPGKAWDQSTAEFKSIEGRESFIRKAKGTPILKETLKFNSTQTVTVQDRPRMEFLYQSPTTGKPIRLLIGFEGGAWKVDRLTL